MTTGIPQDIEHLVTAEDPDLVLLRAKPSWNGGLDLLERICRVSDAPVIFVSGNGGIQVMDRAFELGATDCVIKPFAPAELMARIRAALRSRQAPSQTRDSELFVLGDLSINYSERLVTLAGRRVQLTATEYKLLLELSIAAGRVLTHEQLLTRVWGQLYESDERIIRTYIKELRKKLGDDASRPTYILSEPRVGYRMAKPTSD